MRTITFLIALAAGCDGGEGTDTEDTDGLPPIDTDVEIEPDADGDGYITELLGGDDCDDTHRFIHPDAIEHCDGVDENCNDLVDDNPIDGTSFFEDSDGDGYGAPGSSVFACEGGSGLADNDDDCDDANEALNPGNDEICNGGYDDDCDPTSLETAMIGAAGFSSLNDALAVAIDGDTIELCDGSHLTKGAVVTTDVTITSGSGDRTMSTLDGGVAGAGAMLIVDGGNLTLEHVTVVNANDGAIDALTIGGGTITVDDCLFENNGSDRNGGAISGTTITITNSDFVENDGDSGGAIYASNPGMLTVTDSTFDGNHADSNGGAFYTTAAATFTGVELTGNDATENGGAGAASGGGAFVTFADTTFSGNTAANGGGLYMSGASGTADAATTFEGNVATETYGGGAYILANGNDITWSGGLFSGNITDSASFAAGGGLVLDSSNQVAAAGTIEASGIVADGNQTIGPPSATTGGGLWLSGGNITLTDTVTTNNVGDYGGGTSINNSFGVPVVLERVEFRGNVGVHAGATDVYESDAVLVDCIVEENAGGVGFGAIMVDQTNSTLDVTSSDFGTGLTDNGPVDVYIDDRFPPPTFNFGPDATFFCDWATGTCL